MSKSNTKNKTKQQRFALLEHRTICENTYKFAVALFPELETKDHLQKLRWWIIDEFLKGNNVIQTAKEFVHGITNTFCTESSGFYLEKVADNLPGLFEIIEYERSMSIYKKGKSRELKLNPDHVGFKLLTDIYLNYRSNKKVIMLTGKHLKQETLERKIKKASKQEKIAVRETIEQLKNLPNMVELWEEVNALTKNNVRSRVFDRNFKEAKDYVDAMTVYKDDEGKSEAKKRYYDRTLDHLKEYLEPVYAIVNDFQPRIFDYLDQNTPRELRQRIFKGCYDLDIDASQLTILSWMAGEDGKELRSFLHREYGFWNSLAFMDSYVQPPKGDTLKKKLKKLIYARCYGGNHITFTDPKVMGKYVYTMDEARSVMNTDQYQAICTALNALKRQVIRDNGIYFTANCFMPLNGYNPSQLICRKAQYIESMIMLAVIKEIKHQPRTDLIGAYHDGVLVHFGEQKWANSSLAKLKKTAHDEGLKWGIKSISMSGKIL